MKSVKSFINAALKLAKRSLFLIRAATLEILIHDCGCSDVNVPFTRF